MFIRFYINVSIYLTIVAAVDPAKYGHFDLCLNSIDICKGPKLKNCAEIKATIKNNNSVLYDVDLVKSMAPTKGKVVVYSGKQQLVRLQINNPCNHIFLRPILESIFNVTKNCVILKGHYIQLVNVYKIIHDYYDGMFLYGNITFSSTFYNEDCNLACINMRSTFIPQQQQKS